MNCRENRYIFLSHPSSTSGVGRSFRGQNLKVTKHNVLKVTQNAIILSDYTAISRVKPGK